MIISNDYWQKFLDKLRAVNDTAASSMRAYLERHGMPQTWEQIRAAIDYGYELASVYGEAAAALACEMYDAVGLAEGVFLPAAEPAATATWQETAKVVQGTMKTGNINVVGDGIGRLVKQAGVDTTMHNALRDGAEWAWIPHGDTCAFCITLASRGWQKASRRVMKGDHAEHIHANCDCTFAIRHDSRTDVEGYDPQKYYDMYRNADGKKPQDKINAMRRELYAEQHQ